MAQSATVVLGGYTDEADRRPLATLARTLCGAAFPGGPEGIGYATIYAALKTVTADPDAAPGEPLLAEPLLAGARDA